MTTDADSIRQSRAILKRMRKAERALHTPYGWTRKPKPANPK